MKKTILLFGLLPTLVMAAQKPSMTSMWLDLSFLIAVVISLKVSDISNQQKLIVFSVYIAVGVVTKLIWLPVLLWIGLLVYFKRQA